MSDDVRGDIEAAMASLSATEATPAEAPAPAEEKPTPAPVETATEEIPATEAEDAAAVARARDEKGRFTPGKAETKAPEKAKAPSDTVKPQPGPKSATPPPAAAAPSVTPVPVAGASTETLKAPSSWKPAAREAFARAPREVQEEALRIDREVRGVMQESAPLRKKAEMAEAWQQTVAPYEALFRSEGVEPLQGVQSLVQTYAMLRGPNAPHVVANIIRSLNIPVEALAEALNNPGVQPAPQAQSLTPEMVREMVRGEFDGLRQSATQAKLKAELDAFLAEEPEFINDVFPVAQAMLRSGVANNFKQAYDRACWADDGIRAILQQREAAKAANAKLASTQQARNAASSVRTQPSGVASSGGKSGDLRSDIEAAMAAVSGRR